MSVSNSNSNSNSNIVSNGVDFEALLTLVVKENPISYEKFWSENTPWEMDYYSTEEYDSEWSWLADELSDESYRQGAVIHYYRSVAPDDSEFIRDNSSFDETVSDMARRHAHSGGDAIEPMDWNVGGITYVVDAQIHVVGILTGDGSLTAIRKSEGQI